MILKVKGHRRKLIFKVKGRDIKFIMHGMGSKVKGHEIKLVIQATVHMTCRLIRMEQLWV